MIQTSTQINPREYALIQEGNQATSAISIKQRFNGKNYLDTHVEVLTAGLTIPTPKQFLTQLRNVNQALENKLPLYNANGELIEGQELQDYANTLNHDCWVWLNASFKKGKGYLGLDLVTITGLENGKPVYQREPLQECLSEECYADLDSINSQGLPTQKSPIQKYESGKSIYLWHPRQDSASRFNASPGNADLYCSRVPLYSDSRLGVRHVREAHVKNENF